MDLVTFVRNQRDRVAAWCCIAVGALALLLGWVGVSGTPFPAEQIPYVVTGGLGGLFLLGLGALLWLSADLRDEWRKLDAIDRHVVEAGSLPPPVDAPERSAAQPAVERREVSLR